MKELQNVGQKGERLPAMPDEAAGDSLRLWLEAYFRFDVSTAESSQRMQRRDLETFVEFMMLEEGHDDRQLWTQRLSRAYVDALRAVLTDDGHRRFADRTINRMIAQLKTFASWIHKHKHFPLGHPTMKLPALPTTTLLIDERALTSGERRRMLDAADLLIHVGGRSKDRHRHGANAERPRRKGYRSWRNRAMVYIVIETGMRRAAVVNADLAKLDRKSSTIKVVEKGGEEHPYKISREGLQAIEEYLEHERPFDAEQVDSPALFLPAANNAKAASRLQPKVVNRVWNEVREIAGVEAKTPHSGRHGMGRHLIEKTKNIAVVQRQLGHKNPAYSMQYMRITSNELQKALDGR